MCSMKYDAGSAVTQGESLVRNVRIREKTAVVRIKCGFFDDIGGFSLISGHEVRILKPYENQACHIRSSSCPAYAVL